MRILSERNSATMAPGRGGAAVALGDLPEWDLADLYPGIDAPELRRDLDAASRQAIEFETPLNSYQPRFAWK